MFKSILSWGSLIVLVFAPLAGANIVADRFMYPIDPWAPNCNGYWGTCNIPDAWHLGVDIPAPAGTPVYSSANGVVKHVNLQDGYGYVVIIEHILPSGEMVCSISSHLKSNVLVSPNEEVLAGTLIGYLGTKAENGGWDPHLHIGIKKGPFSLGGYNYTCNDRVLWGYGGYTWCSDQKDTWYNPSDFIDAPAQHTTVTFDYPDFTSVDGLNLVGSALQSVDVLQLTSEGQLQTGAAWFTEKQYIQDGFETTFTFWISRDGADGFAFVIQNEGDNVFGTTGGGIGYQGIAYSLAVEFDTWRNWAGDPGFDDYDVNDNHIGVHTLGSEPNSAGPHAAYPDAIQGETIDIPILSDGAIHTTKISYIPGTLSIYIDNLAVPALVVPIDIASVLALDNGTAWVGFTGSTGGSSEIHDILSWSFATRAANTTPPQPDVTTSALTISPLVLHVGDTATVNALVSNGPDADASPCQATFTFGSSAKTVDVPAILANGSVFLSADFNLGTEGLRVVAVNADSGNIIAESNEGNNITDTLVVVLPPLRPDHPPIRPVAGGITLGYGATPSWSTKPHNGIDYRSALGDPVVSVGKGVVHPYTRPNADRFGSINPNGRGPAIWVRYTLVTGEPIYVLYGHTATSWDDKSGMKEKRFNFSCTYYISWQQDNIVQPGETVGYSAPFYNGGVLQPHLHLSVFKPKQDKKGIYYGPPRNGWGYSDLSLQTGDFIDPEDFFSNYSLLGSID